MKKIIGLLLIGCLGVTLSGCNGDEQDFNNQLHKMNDVINENEIFKEDYSIKTQIEITSKNDSTKYVEYTIVFDNEDKLYIDYNLNDGEKCNTKIWVKEDNGIYYTYVNNDSLKLYKEYKSDTDLYQEFYNLGISINTSLKEAYNSIYNELQQMINKCENGDNDIICSIDKSLFNKVSLNTKEESLSGAIVESYYELKKGKIIEVKIVSLYKDYTSSTLIEFDYDNQIITLPKKNDYKK